MIRKIGLTKEKKYAIASNVVKFLETKFWFFFYPSQGIINCFYPFLHVKKRNTIANIN